MQVSLVDGRYELLRLLGRGGMGEVYLARDELLGREVALKVLKEHYAASGEFLERFRREARHAASFSHPNVVEVFDAGEDGAPYIAMEHLSGGTLAERGGDRGRGGLSNRKRSRHGPGGVGTSRARAPVDPSVAA